MWDYTEKVKEHFFHPHNVGEIDDPDGVGEVGSLACGDALRLTFKLDDDGKIAEAKFRTFGCGSAIASSSALTEMIKGKTLDEALKVTNRDIADYLGGLPEQKMHCSVMGREALEAAIENYRNGSRGAPRQLSGKVICTCYGVTEEEIIRVVRENNLTTVEQVTNYCKAGGGCGGCHADIRRIIEKIWDMQAPTGVPTEPKPTAKAQPMTNIHRIQLVQQTLDQQVRPALQADGGDIELIDVIGHKVVVALRGMCSQCKVANFTIADVVQARLREFVDDQIIVEEQKA
jgi:NifU-like protein